MPRRHPYLTNLCLLEAAAAGIRCSCIHGLLALREPLLPRSTVGKRKRLLASLLSPGEHLDVRYLRLHPKLCNLPDTTGTLAVPTDPVVCFLRFRLLRLQPIVYILLSSLCVSGSFDSVVLVQLLAAAVPARPTRSSSGFSTLLKLT